MSRKTTLPILPKDSRQYHFLLTDNPQERGKSVSKSAPETGSSHDSAQDRIQEIKRTIFALNDEFQIISGRLKQKELNLLHEVAQQKISLIQTRVEAYRLATKIFPRSMRVEIRIHQRTLLYLKMRRRQLAAELNSFGLKLEDVDHEWSQLSEHENEETPEMNSDQAEREEKEVQPDDDPQDLADQLLG